MYCREGVMYIHDSEWSKLYGAVKTGKFWSALLWELTYLKDKSVVWVEPVLCVYWVTSYFRDIALIAKNLKFGDLLGLGVDKSYKVPNFLVKSHFLQKNILKYRN